ncbi:hypothetical protein GCM10027299_49910 [Larkinella ripae]
MTPPPAYRLLPLGELLEQLRQVGFAITPEIYDRCFRVSSAYFPNGLTQAEEDRQHQQLRELLGPVVARSESELENFGLIFDRVLANPELTTDRSEPADPQDQSTSPETEEKPPRPNYRLIGALLLAAVLVLAGIVLYKILTPSPVLPDPVPTPADTNRSVVLDSGLPATPTTSPAAPVESFPLIRAAETVLTTYQLNPWTLLLAVLFGTGAVGAIAYRFFYPLRKIRPSNRPPYFLTFPDQEKTIQQTESLDTWARQLNQRDESQRRTMDIGRSIRATARAGGYPTIHYRPIKVRPRYLVLIDNRSTFHQQARLYSYLGTVLAAGEVELETFFFNADPRICWSEKYPNGIGPEDLYRFHRTSYLVLMTDGIRLIDFNTGALASWVARLFGPWEKRAILTPVYPDNWQAVEQLLVPFFILLPTTPEGQLALRDYFLAQDRPTFSELRERFQVDPDPAPDRGIFGVAAEKLSLADVDRFLEKPFRTEQPTLQGFTVLKQWAYATALYPTPTWEMTLIIGKALEGYYETMAIVTTTNLLKITALPWLQQQKIPEKLRQELLERFSELPEKLKTAVRSAVLDLLQSVPVVPGSGAAEERDVHTYEIWLTDENRKREALQQLAPFQKAGLIADKRVAHRVKARSQRQNRVYWGLLAAVAVFLLAAGYQTQPPGQQESAGGLGRFLYSETARVGSDSAVIYNNLATAVSQDSLKDSATAFRVLRSGQALGFRFPSPFQTTALRSLPEAELYALRIVFLRASGRYRPTFEALYNLHALRYQRGAELDTARQLVSQEKVVALRNIKAIMAPTAWFLSADRIPPDSTLAQYLKILNLDRPIDTIRTQLRDLAGDSHRPISYYRNDNLEIQTIRTARQAAQFNRVQLVLPDAPTDKSLLTLTISRLPLSASQIDSLARLNAAWIQLNYRPSLANEPVESAPPVSSTVTSRRTPARKQPVRTNKKGPVRSKNPVYQAPAQTRPEQVPPTATPQQQTPATNVPTDTTARVKQPDRPATTVQRGIPGEYGVLVGTLTQSSVVNDDLYLKVRVGKADYRVKIDARQPNAPTSQAIIAIAQGAAVRKIPAYQKFSSAAPGFYPVEKNGTAGALDYVRTGDSYQDFKVVDKMAVPDLRKLMLFVQQFELTEAHFYELLRRQFARIRDHFSTDGAGQPFHENRALAPANLLENLAIPRRSQPRIYVWGARWQPGSDDRVFKMPNGFYELHFVHFNQGSVPPNDSFNAPWQDGGLMIEGSTLQAVAIRFSSQSTQVDENGDPLKPATAK